MIGYAIVLADAGGPALAGALLIMLAIMFFGVGLVVGLIVYLIARGRAKKRALSAQPPPY